METYHGHVRTPTDVIILFEACRLGLLPRVQRRLSEKERHSIRSGSVFVWDEREAGMRRWTDGKSWSASRVSGSFLTYREMEGKRGNSEKIQGRDDAPNQETESDGGPDGYRYKPDGLMKQSFSLTTTNGQHLHLISYFSRSSQISAELVQPSNDAQLRHIRPEKGIYPESTVQEASNIPPVTRGPMHSPGSAHLPNQHPPTYPRPPYGFPHHPGWAPPSPMQTPPPYPPYYHGTHPGQSSLGAMPYPPYHHPGMGPYDRPPHAVGAPGLPPLGPHYPGPMPPQGSYPGYPGYQGGYGAFQPPSLGPHHYVPPLPQHALQRRERSSMSSVSVQVNAGTDPPPSQVPTQGQKDSKADKDKPSDSTRSASVSNNKPSPPPPTGNCANGSSGVSEQIEAQAGAPAPAGSNKTIPSISAMLNVGKGIQPPPRNNSRSPSSSAPRPSQDIPVHKLGFEASRDVQALRSLDGYSTLKK